jgi:hypothetical protein
LRALFDPHRALSFRIQAWQMRELVDALSGLENDLPAATSETKVPMQLTHSH